MPSFRSYKAVVNGTVLPLLEIRVDIRHSVFIKFLQLSLMLSSSTQTQLNLESGSSSTIQSRISSAIPPFAFRQDVASSSLSQLTTTLGLSNNTPVQIPSMESVLPSSSPRDSLPHLHPPSESPSEFEDEPFVLAPSSPSISSIKLPSFSWELSESHDDEMNVDTTVTSEAKSDDDDEETWNGYRMSDWYYDSSLSATPPPFQPCSSSSSDDTQEGKSSEGDHHDREYIKKHIKDSFRHGGDSDSERSSPESNTTPLVIKIPAFNCRPNTPPSSLVSDLRSQYNHHLPFPFPPPSPTPRHSSIQPLNFSNPSFLSSHLPGIQDEPVVTFKQLQAGYYLSSARWKLVEIMAQRNEKIERKVEEEIEEWEREQREQDQLEQEQQEGREREREATQIQQASQELDENQQPEESSSDSSYEDSSDEENNSSSDSDQSSSSSTIQIWLKTSQQSSYSTISASSSNEKGEGHSSITDSIISGRLSEAPTPHNSFSQSVIDLPSLLELSTETSESTSCDPMVCDAILTECEGLGLLVSQKGNQFKTDDYEHPNHRFYLKGFTGRSEVVERFLDREYGRRR
ncbi:hypothetical protein C8Q75DRAFT_811879 [Abortiporus biennis]|nr:hypothetical protein C8Q75DRAFT_811879 [Abortiporus biennis]